MKVTTNRANAHRVLSVIFCSVMIAVAIVGFASCDKQNDKGEDEIVNNTEEVGVTIAGVTWATRNVDAPGTFAEKPSDYGMFYQWNRNVGWSSTEEIVSGWYSGTPTGDTWEIANDPSPLGWRVPTFAELETLFDEEKVSHEWTTIDGETGLLFTDKFNDNSIFLPAAGCRDVGGVIYRQSVNGYYYSSTPRATGIAYSLKFSIYNHEWEWECLNGAYGRSIRCVAK
ncbi:MAG: fibrobacter succinogenes major paralogous domain-containing protein [Bacteroidales bacterium]|jgi:uncharacterized protein (TIGR02145 family)|nr:fibrobacter succinogenes major paralogous domain-containing protein [Bacteroidales bacterium]